MKRILSLTPVYTLIITLFFLSACSSNDNDTLDEPNNGNGHTYQIEISGGKTYQGGVPKYAPGVVKVYNAISFIEYDEDFGKIMTGMLWDTGKFQFGIGLVLDGDNKPSIQGSGPGLVFGEWGTEDKYKPVGSISMTLKNYKEHNISMYGEEAVVASYTLTFSGKFKLGTDGEEVDVTGEVVVAAP